MSKTMKKDFFVLEVVNIVSYFNAIKNDETKKAKFAELSPRTYFALKRNIATLTPVAKEFEDMRNEFVEKLKQEYFMSEEKSEECVVPQNDKNGEPILDEEGNQVTEAGRKVKDEYYDEFIKAKTELDRKLQEVLMEKNEYQLYVVDLFEELDKLPDDTMIDNDDIDILTFMDRGDE